jgi:RimJ/RimL family protein N-acetyltransferase
MFLDLIFGEAVDHHSAERCSDYKLVEISGQVEENTQAPTRQLDVTINMAAQSQDQPSDVIITLPNNITVRRYRLTDTNSLSLHANNRQIWNNLRNRIPYPYTPKDSETWIRTNLDSKDWVASGPYTPSPDGALGGTSSGELIPTNYCICVNDEAVGSIGLDFGAPGEIYARNAEIGYWLSESHWGKGIMGVVVPAFVEWGWRTFGRLVRINAEVREDNVGSRRCLEKAGLVVEGRRKMGFVKNGVFENEIMMGMLRPRIEESEAK